MKYIITISYLREVLANSREDALIKHELGEYMLPKIDKTITVEEVVDEDGLPVCGEAKE